MTLDMYWLTSPGVFVSLNTEIRTFEIASLIQTNIYKAPDIFVILTGSLGKGIFVILWKKDCLTKIKVDCLNFPSNPG